MKKIATPLEKTLEFAKTHYGAKTNIFGTLLFEHCSNVARQAETIAQRLYQDVRADCNQDSTKESVLAIIQVALLHDVLNTSACAFENIAETATVQVAAMVADISRDFRLVETKRDMEFRGRLSQSPVAAQIVVVADIICTANEALRFLQAGGLSAVPKAKKILTQLDGDLLAIHAASRYYILRLFVHAARNLIGEISQKIKDCRHKAKVEKFLAQNTKKLRDRIEQQNKAKPGKKPKAKKKEVRYAKKRINDKDTD
jgi:hypothetical protein